MRLILDFSDEIEEPVPPRQIAEVIHEVTTAFEGKVDWSLDGDPDDSVDVHNAVGFLKSP